MFAFRASDLSLAADTITANASFIFVSDSLTTCVGSLLVHGGRGGSFSSPPDCFLEAGGFIWRYAPFSCFFRALSSMASNPL